jgi:hypothetical protein
MPKSILLVDRRMVLPCAGKTRSQTPKSGTMRWRLPCCRTLNLESGCWQYETLCKPLAISKRRSQDLQFREMRSRHSLKNDTNRIGQSKHMKDKATGMHGLCAPETLSAHMASGSGRDWQDAKALVFSILTSGHLRLSHILQLRLSVFRPCTTT